MLGNHVNVSARNKKLIHKILCAFLAVVLLGLMIPHGITASLNAYAEGENAAEQPAADNPVAPEEESTPSEEVNSEEPVPVAPVVGETEANVTQTATIFVDFRAYGAGTLTLASDIAPLPDGWGTVSDADGFKGIQRTVQWDDEEATPPTYGEVLSDLDVFVKGGTRADDIVKSADIPSGVDLVTFAYKVGQSIDLNDPLEANPVPKNVEPELVTSITIEVDDDVPNPILKYSHSGSTNVTYEGWPTASKDIEFLKYKSSYSISTGSGFLHDAIVVDIHKEYSNFEAWCEVDSPYKFTTFSTSDTDREIVPGLTFKAEFSTEAIINFKTDLGTLPTGITFYKWDTTLTTPAYVPADFATATVDTENNFVKSEVHGTDGYVGGITIDDVEYAFKINVTEGLGADYEFSQWQCSSDDSSYTPVGENPLPIGNNLYFKANFNIRLSFGTNDPTKGTVKKSGTTVTDPIYLPMSTTVVIEGNKVTINPNEYLATETDADLYAFIGWENNPETFDISTPTLLKANFAVTPVVTLNLDDEDYDSYLEAPAGGYEWDNPVPSLKVGSTVKQGTDKTKLVFGNTSVGVQTFTAALTDLGKHYIEFGDDVWYIKTEGEEGPEYTAITTTGITLEDGDSYSIVIHPVVLELLTLSGTVTDVNGTGIAGAQVTADVTIEGTTETKIATTDDDGKYAFTKEMPNNVSVKVYARAAGLTPNDLAPFNLTADKTDANVTLSDKALTFAYGDGVSGKDWKDTTGVKTISSSANITPVTGVETYNFADNSTLSITVCQNDVVRLYNYTGDINNNALSFDGGAADPWSRSISHTVSTEGQSTLTITFSGENHVDFIAIVAAERTVTFEVTKAEDSSAAGYFNDSSTDVTYLTVSGMGATYKLNSDADKVTFVDGDKTTNIQALASHDPGTESIFREWVGVTTDEVPIVDNITLKARFVQENVKLIFDKGSSPVTAEGTAETTIKMDSEFSQVRTDSTHADAIFTLDSTPVKKTINIKDADKIKYKFAETVFSGVPEGKEIINETNYSTIEKDGLKLNYSIIERTPIDVTIDLRDGHLVDPYKFPAVSDAVGGIGVWSHDASTDEYKNKFYEEYPISTILSEYLNNAKEPNITKDSGFFNETWEGASEGPLTTDNNTWTANYDDAGHLTGTVYTSQSASSIAEAGVIVELSNSENADPIAPDVHSVQYTTGADGKYDLKVYAKKKFGHVTTGTLTAGSKTYIEKDVDITDTNWDADGKVGTQDFSGELALDKGYSFFPSDYQALSYSMYARYYDRTPDSPKIAFGGSVAVSEDNVTLSGNATLTFEIGNNFRLDSGDELIMTTSTVSGHFNVETPYCIIEDVPITDPEFLYTCFASEVKLNVKSTANEEAKEISRIDYRMPWEEYISVYGTVTEQGTGNPLSGIKVSYNANNSNEEVKEKYTNDSGQYYIILKTLKGTETGTVMFEDVDGVVDDDHLDERVRLSSDDTTDIKPTTPAKSGDTSIPEMIPAAHIKGHVDYQNMQGDDPYPAQNVVVAYTKAKDTPTPPGWDGWEESINDGYVHGFAYTDENGDYSMKIKKGAAPEYDPDPTSNKGAYVWFTYHDPEEGEAALDCRIVQKDGATFKFDTDLEFDTITMLKAGGEVKVQGDQSPDSGHAGFEVITYGYGKVLGIQQVDDPTDAFQQKLAEAGQVFTSYDSKGRNVLRYVFDPAGDGSSPAQFEMTLRPIAQDGFTYWKWTFKDAFTGETKTLYDDTLVEIEETSGDQVYEFTTYYAESDKITLNGDASAGHAGWNIDISVNDQKEYDYTIGPDAFEFKIPISNDNANVSEPITTAYQYDGKSFILNLSSQFTKEGTGEKVDYDEVRALTPIAAEGYMFTGISVNGQDMVSGADPVKIDSETDELVVTAHYAPIPELVQTSDDGNFWWLIALAVLACAGIGYGLNRREKGIRR